MSDNMDDIIGKIKNNSSEDNKKLAEEMRNKLTPEQAKAFNKLLGNKSLVEKLLNSDEAKNIMNKLGGDGDGHK